MAEKLTIGRLARNAGLSRATLLYYDRLGLLQPRGRSGGNYRVYGPADAQRLEQILLYRSMGIPLKEMAPLLDQTLRAGSTEAILRRRLSTLEAQIESLHGQQQQILRLLERFPSAGKTQTRGKGRHGDNVRLPGKGKSKASAKENDVVNKKRWVEIMTAAGFGEQEMRNWHRQFEKMEPDAHQEFLESLQIEAAEIGRIREWSRQ
jgi:DNA-binding transcriptional MerR regulator